MFGHEIVDTSNWGTDQLRLWQRSKGSASQMDERLSEVLQSDQVGVIDNNIPTTILDQSIVMTDFTDDDGVHLEYAFARKLQNYKRNGLNLRDSFIKKVHSKDFSKKLKTEDIDETKRDKLPTNQGHKELAVEARTYYKGLEELILKDSRFLQQFRNEEGENLYTVVKQMQKLGKVERKKTREPMSIQRAAEEDVSLIELLNLTQ